MTPVDYSWQWTKISVEEYTWNGDFGAEAFQSTILSGKCQDMWNDFDPINIPFDVRSWSDPWMCSSRVGSPWRNRKYENNLWVPIPLFICGIEISFTSSASINIQRFLNCCDRSQSWKFVVDPWTVFNEHGNFLIYIIWFYRIHLYSFVCIRYQSSSEFPVNNAIEMHSNGYVIKEKNKIFV